MNEEITQGEMTDLEMPLQSQETDITPDEAAAALALATHMQDEMLGQSSEGEDVSQETMGEPLKIEKDPQEDIRTEMADMESRIMESIEGLREELKNPDLESLKSQIDEAINEDE